MESFNLAEIAALPIHERIEAINKIKLALHNISPFKREPVDCVLWVRSDWVTANDYNPNAVAPPEMKLLAISIGEDGYTQPIVTWMENDKIGGRVAHFSVVISPRINRY